ncbi:MurR/RpiR family transcriptional regulator [Enterovibrio nigricans]|uniref:Transcriptional regulator, RpiR family n=1 Tax=Enterovibrio nigricans DSM 22720 TaxID=1121868 RepID=A0A1T4UUS4_9GAMM|nr:MurR/RpiR family transcriptional regulator [Enterovibrio nigricans]SKA56368.1 transcriptional regulator, RpiR family [Enterovibrio nigricans DSM 22720]
MATANHLAELQLQIRQRYPRLSKRLQQVAQYVLDNPNSIAFDTVAVIAAHANVPPSTLIRFANAFDFSGFNEMKQLFRRKLVEETSSYTKRAQLIQREEHNTDWGETPSDVLNQFVHANSLALQELTTTMSDEDLNHAVDLLENAETIYVVAMRRAFSIASYLAYGLCHLERKVILVDSIGGMGAEQLSRINENDVLIAASFSPYSPETVTLCQNANKSKAKQIVITDSQLSPLALTSDVCFLVNEAEVESFRSQTASLCLSQSLVVSLAFRLSRKETV